MVRRSVVTLFWLAACTGTHAPPVPEGPKMECTSRVAAGEELASKLVSGAVVCLGKGEHQGPLTITESVTIVGEPGAILTGRGLGPVVTVVAPNLVVTLSGLTITDGYGETGSGLYIDAWSRIVLENCRVDGNREPQGPGRGLWAAMGDIVVRGTTFGPADDVAVRGIAKIRLEASTLGRLAAGDGAEVTVTGGAIDVLSVAGTTSRAPTVALHGTKVGKIENDPDVPGTITGP